ncbi:uncharacterized protein LOC131159902 [Malania oleifera]|uniref:uncharacterized protein LOC131159902 n=1 Tax=Malania oleifera TaxID=397392 RepID=UPI0025AEA703|nr:uncharacterized protein LOC131159902 [Malania oleifera]
MMEWKNFHPSRRFSLFRSVFDGVSAVALFFLFYNQEEFLRNKFLRSAPLVLLPQWSIGDVFFSQVSEVEVIHRTAEISVPSSNYTLGVLSVQNNVSVNDPNWCGNLFERKCYNSRSWQCGLLLCSVHWLTQPQTTSVVHWRSFRVF